MYSLIEYIINERGDDAKAARFRAGGPGSRDQEKDRHRQEVSRLRQRYARRKQRGFSSSSEKKYEKQRHALAKKGEQKRHIRSFKGQHGRH